MGGEQLEFTGKPFLTWVLNLWAGVFKTRNLGVIITIFGIVATIYPSKRYTVFCQTISIAFALGGLILYFLIRDRDMINESNKKSEENVNTAISNSQDKINTLLKDVKIFYETPVKGYDNGHVNTILSCVSQLKRASHIYAIDNSDPIQWWNDSMSAYLAILAKWKSAEPKRKVSRVFVFREGDFYNILTFKTIQFHLLLGFQTYVYSYKSFKKYFDEYTKLILKKKCLIEPREVLIWDGKDIKYPSLSFDTNSRGVFKDVLFYQSFWNIDEHRDEMKQILYNNGDMYHYHGGLILK